MRKNIKLVENIKGKVVVIDIGNTMDNMLGDLVGIDNIKYITKEIREKNNDKDLYFIRETASKLYMELIRRGENMEDAYNKTLRYIKGL